MLELGIVHVRLPGQQRQRFAVAGDDVKLLIRHRRQFGRVPGGVVEAELVELLARHGEDVGNVELVGRAGLHADRADEHQPLDPFRHLGRDLGGDPSADRETDEIGSRQTQAIHQFQVNVGNVVHAVEPVRQRRFAETGMRRRDHAPAFREQVDEWSVAPDAGATMQIENGLALPALEHVELDPRN